MKSKSSMFERYVFFVPFNIEIVRKEKKVSIG